MGVLIGQKSYILRNNIMKESEISRLGFMKLGALTLGGAGLATGLKEKAAVSLLNCGPGFGISG